MNTNDIMKMVTAEMNENGANPEEIAKIQIAIQYFGNPEFRERLSEYVFNETYNK